MAGHDEMSSDSVSVSTTPHSEHGDRDTSVTQRRRRIEAVRYKTRMCKHLEQTGNCPFGAKCAFAHNDEELRSVEGNAADGIVDIRRLRQYQRQQRNVPKTNATKTCPKDLNAKHTQLKHSPPTKQSMPCNNPYCAECEPEHSSTCPECAAQLAVATPACMCPECQYYGVYYTRGYYYPAYPPYYPPHYAAPEPCAGP